MNELAIRPATPDDWSDIRRLLRLVFHSGTDDADLERIKHAVFEPARSLVVTEEAELVGHTGAFTRELSVPGATVAAAHVSMVGVAPTHRRRGVLTRLMHRQLSELPEPVAVLWATEGVIYPRFGYGMASQRVSFTVASREVVLPPAPEPTGRLRTIPASTARSHVADFYESLRPTRPGWSSRNEPWWDHVLADPPGLRHGATELRVTLAEDSAGALTGYAVWRTKGEWDPTGPRGEVQVEEVIAQTPEATLRLWHFLLGIDLTRRASLWLSGPADPLLQLAAEKRKLGAVLADGLYVRVVDLPAALAARRYAAPLDLVIEVTDPLLPANSGRWRLIGDAAGAACSPATGPADVACSITALAAAYLGGIRLTDLAAAGQVQELRPGALAAATTGFGWHQAPAGIEIF